MKNKMRVHLLHSVLMEECYRMKDKTQAVPRGKDRYIVELEC